MSEVTLEERGRALENQFYEKENQQKLAAMKEKLESQQTREELRKASGMSDDAVLDKLVALGLKANERNAIPQGAHGKGLEQGTDGYELLQTWLSKRPDDALFDAWESYIKA